MRLGGNVFHWQNDPELYAEKHVQWGFRAAFFPETLPPEADPKAFADALAKRDIRLAEVGAWGHNALSADDKTAAEGEAFFMEKLALAEELGAATCVGVLGTRCRENWYGPHGGNYSPDFFTQAVDMARRVLRQVNPHRTTLSFEIMPYSFLDSPEEYLRFVKAVGDPRVKVHLDPCNCINHPRLYYQNGAWLARIIPLLGEHIVSVHLKDILLLPQPVTVQFQEVEIGRGNLCYPTLLRELQKLDKDLPVMLEHLPDEAAYGRNADTVRRIANENGITL